MKCKNCGANYKTRELICPHCHTENIIGKIWKNQRTEAQETYDKRKKELRSRLTPKVLDKILSRSIVILVALYVVVGLIFYLIVQNKGGLKEWYEDYRADEVREMLQNFHAKGQYGEMAVYIEEENIPEKKYEEYVQAVYLFDTYENYMNGRMEFFAHTKEELENCDNCLESAISEAFIVYRLGYGKYNSIHEINQELYDSYKEELEAFFMGELHMTWEEIHKVASGELRYGDSGYVELMDDIKERVIDEKYSQ